MGHVARVRLQARHSHRRRCGGAGRCLAGVCAADLGWRLSRVRLGRGAVREDGGLRRHVPLLPRLLPEPVAGSGWRTDYPGADNNFSVRLAELTRIPVKFDPDKQPHYVVIPLTDATLFRCPMLFMEDVGTVDFSAQEVKQLREFCQTGGFLWTDDWWGSAAWANWVEQIGRVLPPGEFPIVDVPVNHPIMHVLYNVPSIPQVPNIGFWRQYGGQTSERGADSAQVYFKGIFDAHRRLMVLMSHNTDIADTWEREGAPPHEYFDLFSPRGYAIGVNVILYVMTH